DPDRYTGLGSLGIFPIPRAFAVGADNLRVVDVPLGPDAKPSPDSLEVLERDRLVDFAFPPGTRAHLRDHAVAVEQHEVSLALRILDGIVQTIVVPLERRHSSRHERE